MVRKTIAIIGANEKMGTAVAKELVTGPYRLLLIGNDGECLSHLLQELKAIVPGTDAEVFQCMVDASWEADLIILAIPICDENETAAMIREVANGKTVICIADLTGKTSIEELEAQLPYSKVVRALSASLSDAPYIPVIDGRTVSTYIEQHRN